MSFWNCTIANKDCSVKVLRTDEDRAMGYQHHPTGPTSSEGLLFLFTDNLPKRMFHMRNVSFNLDLLGFDKEGKLICTIPMKSNNEEQYPIPAGCKFIIEIIEGWSKDLKRDEDGEIRLKLH